MPSIPSKISSHIKGKPSNRALATIMDDYWKLIPDSAIFGGMIRDFGLSTPFRSDIDIVSDASPDAVWGAIERYQPSRNKYGGFRFDVGGQKFDIWCLQETWAIRHGFVRATSLHDLVHTTFFNLDAAIYLYGDGKLQALESYKQALADRFLDINLAHHPEPAAMAKRAVQMALTKGLRLSPRLSKFVLQYCEFGDSQLVSHFMALLRAHLAQHSGEPFGYARQLTLWDR
jgi:hypothetical protein